MCSLTGDPQAELVRHFLIEPTAKGVRLKGCSTEPVFGELWAGARVWAYARVGVGAC